jgi:hypothetical protein
MESSLTKFKKYLKLLVKNTFLEFNKSYHNDTPYAFFIRVLPEDNSVYTLILSEEQLSNIANYYSTSEKEILDTKFLTC